MWLGGNFFNFNFISLSYMQLQELLAHPTSSRANRGVGRSLRKKKKNSFDNFQHSYRKCARNTIETTKGNRKQSNSAVTVYIHK